MDDSDDDDQPAKQTRKEPEPASAPVADLLDMGGPGPASSAGPSGFSDLLGGLGDAPAAQQNTASNQGGNNLLDLGGGQNDLLNMDGNQQPSGGAPSSGFDFMQSSS